MFTYLIETKTLILIHELLNHAIDIKLLNLAIRIYVENPGFLRYFLSKLISIKNSEQFQLISSCAKVST